MRRVDSDGTGTTYSNVQILPNIYVLDTIYNIGGIYSGAFGETSVTTSAKCFHRIYLIDKNLNRVGRCDINWSIDLHVALADFVAHHKNVLDIIIPKKGSEEPLTETERLELQEASDAYNTFNLDFGNDILYNDFVSYELLYYLFGSNAYAASQGGTYPYTYATDFNWSNGLIMAVTTDEVKSFTN